MLRDGISKGGTIELLHGWTSSLCMAGSYQGLILQLLDFQVLLTL
jgi:hypothetical protein